jgi:NNP family nitrate/nitrite transporter-like MFS transporter
MRPVIFLSVVFFANMLSRTIFSPLLPSLEEDLGIYHAKAGGLLLLVAVGYGSSMVLSGFLSARITHRRTILLSNGLVSVGLVAVALGRSLLHVRIAVLFLGLCCGLYLASGMSTIYHLVERQRWGRAISIHELAPNLAFVAAPLLAQLLLPLADWRRVLLVLVGGNMLVGLLYLVLGSKDPSRGEPPVFGNLREIFRERSFWIVVVLFVLAASAEVGVYSMLPTYLITERGFPLSRTSALIAASRLIGIVVMFAAGWLADRVGFRRTLVALLTSGGAVTILLGVSGAKLLPMTVLLQAPLVVAFFPVGLSALARIGPSKSQNLNVSFLVPIAYMFGGGLVPAGLGILGERGSFELGFVVLGAALAASAALVRLLTTGRED